MRTLLSASLIVCLAGSLVPGTASAAPETEKVTLKQVRDLPFGNTLFYFFQRQYFSSIIRLSVAQELKTIPHHADDAELLMGGMYLSFGMHREAETIFKSLADERVPKRLRNRAWFYLAKIQYQRNLYPEAEQAISRIDGALPGEQELERRLLYAKILMAQQRYSEADTYLEQYKEKSIWTVYARFNLAVSLIKQNNVERGQAILQEIGKMKAPEKEMQAVRDRSNLALGYSYIQEDKPDQAIGYLRKVRLQGHLSNKALLGLGWAYDQKKQYNKALAPWLELNKRSALDSAVQESFLATAYALGKLKRDSRALQHYNTAIEIYQGEIQRLEDTMIHIEGGEYLNKIIEEQTRNEMGWFWELQQAPETHESHYLLSLLASHTFQESLKNYRDLRLLSSNLETWAHNIEVFDTILETRRQAYNERLPRIQQNTERLKTNELQKLRDRYNNEINRVIQTNDILGLASKRERKYLHKLELIKQKLDNIDTQRDVSDAREKYRLLSGVITWDIASQYGPRVWQIKKGIKQLDKGLKTYNQYSGSIKRAEKAAPLSFEGYGTRISGLRTRIQALLQQANATLLEQEKLLKSLAIYELQQQQDRIAAYLTHAQFSVAQIQDRASQKQKTRQQEEPKP